MGRWSCEIYACSFGQEYRTREPRRTRETSNEDCVIQETILLTLALEGHLASHYMPWVVSRCKPARPVVLPRALLDSKDGTLIAKGG